MVNVGFSGSISYSIQSLRTLVLFDRSLLLHFYPTNPGVIPPTDFVESCIAHRYSGCEFMTKEGWEELAEFQRVGYVRGAKNPRKI